MSHHDDDVDQMAATILALTAQRSSDDFDIETAAESLASGRTIDSTDFKAKAEAKPQASPLLTSENSTTLNFGMNSAPHLIAGDGKESFSNSIKNSEDASVKSSVQMDQVDASSGVASRPGAVRVPGMRPSNGRSIYQGGCDESTADANPSTDTPVTITEGITEESLQSEIRERVLEAAVSAVDVHKVSETKSAPRNKRTRLFILLGIGILVVAGLVTGLVLGIGKNGKKDNASEEGNNSGESDNAPIEDDFDGTSTISAPDVFIEAIVNSPLKALDTRPLFNESSTQFKAVQWLCQEDNAIDCINPATHQRLFEVYALVAFLYECNLEDRLSEIVDFDACSFPGIHCDSEPKGFVEEFVFANEQLECSVLEEFGFFTKIVHFDVSNNPGLVGSVSSIWGNQWRQLVTFNISYSSLGGVLPSEFGEPGRAEPRNVFIQGTNISSIERVEIDLCGPPPPAVFSANCLGISVASEEGNNRIYCPCCTECCDSVGLGCIATNGTTT